MLNLDLVGKVALVTGGSQGIGRGIALTLAKAGATVAIAHYDRSDDKANETLNMINDLGCDGAAYKVNVASAVEVKDMVASIISKFGKIDILVNNAGISTVGNLDELSYEQIQAVLNVNLMGPFTVCKEVLPSMIANKFGRIINIASTSMYTGGGGGAHYAASKSGLMGMMRNMSKVYGKDNITTNNLAISLIDTELFRERYPEQSKRDEVISHVPVQRAGTPEDVGYACAFLASDWASYINGEILQIDGGRMYV
ncbi:MAG: SDR family oxidoreductase [Erysipelotrichaceae bacterium]